MKNESQISFQPHLLSWVEKLLKDAWKTRMDNVAGTAEALRLAQPAKEVLSSRQTQVIALSSQGEGISKGSSL